MFSRSASRVISRSYATSSKVVAPVALQTLTGKYASAAFVGALTKGESTLTQTSADLKAIGDLISKGDESAAFLINPTLSASERASALSSLTSKFSKITPITTSLLEVLSENGRLASIQQVLEDFDVLVKAHTGSLEVLVTSAAPLDSKTLSQIETTLKNSESAKGKALRVVNKVKADILGGIIIEVGDKSIDLSAQSKVNKLNAVLAR